MRITELRLQNFKRFTDLTIKNIPPEAKLVLLIGANGSGKSAAFDAFEWANKDDDKTWDENQNYYRKNTNQPTQVAISFDKDRKLNKTVEANDNFYVDRLLPKNSFFGRPSMRIVPSLTNAFYDSSVFSNNSDGPTHFIDFDTRFHTDVKKFTGDISRALRDPLFKGDTSVDLIKIAEEFIEPINQSLLRIFGEDPQINIKIANYEDAGSRQNEPPKLVFVKGKSRINYDLLSHGEKQIIIILLNFIVRRAYFQDTIYYIDEMDVHLNTSLQYTLLKEITENWIPGNCQLWTASHALGFIEYAKDADIAAIIDFDNFDFDEEQTIEPSPKYEDTIFEVAIPRASLTKILGNRKVVLCENKNYTLYSLMGLDGFVFTDVQNSNSVYLKIKRDKTLIGLRDRDYLTDSEIQKLTTKFPNYKILRYYCFENYLYHPTNLITIGLTNFDIEVYKMEITALKNQYFDAFVPKISESRKAYEEFRDGGIKPDTDISDITKCLKSDDFETFYTYFSFKDHCGSLTHKYKVDKKEIKEKLCQTLWFRDAIDDILK